MGRIAHQITDWRAYCCLSIKEQSGTTSGTRGQLPFSPISPVLSPPRDRLSSFLSNLSISLPSTWFLTLYDVIQLAIISGWSFLLYSFLKSLYPSVPNMASFFLLMSAAPSRIMCHLDAILIPRSLWWVCCLLVKAKLLVHYSKLFSLRRPHFCHSFPHRPKSLLQKLYAKMRPQ